MNLSLWQLNKPYQPFFEAMERGETIQFNEYWLLSGGSTKWVDLKPETDLYRFNPEGLRIKPKEPVLKEWTQETFPIGNVWIRRKDETSWFVVTRINTHSVNVDGRIIGWSLLAKEYEWTRNRQDIKPCGVRE